MATSGKVVEVLCPSGRRQKVKTNPSLTVFQILQEVCVKQGYIDDEYDLKHQRKVLNVTSMMRFLNLPNNAKLELVKCEKSRLVSDVIVAIQMEDGTRYQENFKPETTLLNVLKTFINEIEALENSMNHEPVCIYMRNEYKGVSVLSNTTLKAVGITSGRAAIRVLFRDIKDCEPTKDVPPTGEKQATNNSFPCELEEPNGKKIKLAESEVKASTSHNQSRQERNITSQEKRLPETSTEGNAYTSLSIIGPPPRQIFPDDKEISTIKYNSALPDANINIAARNEFANFKFPENTSDDSDAATIDPNLIRKEVKLGMPCERKSIIFNMETIQSPSDTQEPDDSFFQVTIDDLQKRLSALKSERKGAEDEMLMTSALREQKKIERVSNFEMIPVRLIIPGKFVLQGIFRPLETIGAIKEFLGEYLSAGIGKPELFVTPPRVVLKDKNQTLYDAKLFPAAVIHVSFNNASGPYLKQEYLDNLSTCDEAEAIVDMVLKRKHKESDSALSEIGSNTYSKDEDTMQCQPSSSTSSSNKSSHSASFQSGQPPKGAPKWFKTGR